MRAIYYIDSTELPIPRYGLQVFVFTLLHVIVCENENFIFIIIIILYSTYSHMDQHIRRYPTSNLKTLWF